MASSDLTELLVDWKGSTGLDRDWKYI